MILLRASLLWLFSIALLVGINYVDQFIPKDRFGDITLPGLELGLDWVTNLFKLVTASLVFSILRTVILPNMGIDDSVKGEGEFEDVAPQIRAAAIIGWSLIYITVLYSFMVI